MSRWIAVWESDIQLTQDQMRIEGRPAIEAAIRQHAESVTLPLEDGREATLTRRQFSLPVFVESPDHREANEFVGVIEERVFETLPN